MFVLESMILTAQNHVNLLPLLHSGTSKDWINSVTLISAMLFELYFYLDSLALTNA
jgi:hypothetical protein